MDGLECSEVFFSELDFSNRLDAEYYQKLHLKYKTRIESIKHNRLDSFADFLIGPFGSAYNTSNYVEFSEYRYIRGQDVKPFELQSTSARYMAKEDYDRLSKYALKPGDILVSVVGTIGNTCIVSEKDVPGIFSCKCTVIRVKNINPFYLTCYLNSKYGRSLLLRQERGAIQKGLNLDDLKMIPIPEFNDKLYKLFETLLKNVDMLQGKSRLAYESAENLLMNELNINILAISDDGVAVKSFSESFGSTGRLDAEYYQDKNYEVINLLKSQGTIGTFCNIYDKSFIPNDNEYYQYIELANIGKSGEIDGVELIAGNKLPSRARRLIKKGNVIVSSIEGSLESCAIVTDEYDGSLCSTGFYVIDSDTYNSETLLVLLKSRPIQMLFKRSCSGTILTNITKEEFLQIPLPEVTDSTQNIIKNKVTEAYLFRDKGKAFLEYAKQAVEMAIEKDELSAVVWLENKISELTGEVAHG